MRFVFDFFFVYENESQWMQAMSKMVVFKVKCCYFSSALPQQSNGKSVQKFRFLFFLFLKRNSRYVFAVAVVTRCCLTWCSVLTKKRQSRKNHPTHLCMVKVKQFHCYGIQEHFAFLAIVLERGKIK